MAIQGGVTPGTGLTELPFYVLQAELHIPEDENDDAYIDVELPPAWDKPMVAALNISVQYEDGGDTAEESASIMLPMIGAELTMGEIARRNAMIYMHNVQYSIVREILTIEADPTLVGSSAAENGIENEEEVTDRLRFMLTIPASEQSAN